MSRGERKQAGKRPRGRRARVPLRPMALLVTLLAGLTGGPAQSQTLNEALTAAYLNNPTLQAARARLRSVNEGVPQALSNWRPRVALGGSLGKRRSDTEGSGFTSNGTATPLNLNATVSQPLYRGGRTIADTQRAEAEVLAERQRLRATEQSVLLRAATAYMDVWRDRDVLSLNRKNEEVLQRQLEATQDRFTVGEVTRTDVAQAETRLAVAVAARIAAEGDLRASEAVFLEVIGRSPGELFAPEPMGGLPSDAGDLIAGARENNPDVLAARHSERAARHSVRETFGELLPSASLDGSLSHSEETGGGDSDTDQAEILAQISVPLYQRGAVSSRVRQAKQVASQRLLELEETLRRIDQEAIGAWEALLSARAQIISFEAGVRSARIALEGVRQENAVGARTILDILDAEQELLDSEVNLLRSRRDETVASFSVLSAAGQLAASGLALPVETYDPGEAYRAVRDRWFSLEAPGGEPADRP